MPSPTLKPCPFCGGSDIELETSATERAGKWTWYDAMVACHSCRCKTGRFEETSKSGAVALAVAAWNRRAGDAVNERYRLRDLVRRLCAEIDVRAMLGACDDLLREARAAIGEDAK